MSPRRRNPQQDQEIQRLAIYGEAAPSRPGQPALLDLHLEAMQARAEQLAYTVRPHVHPGMLQLLFAGGGVCRATIDGDALGSQRLVFKPRGVRGGSFRFAIATAGSTTLVLQTVLPALWAAPESSSIELQGGTHNPMAPPFDFLQHAFAPVMHRMGAPLQLELDVPGFYPAGGGRWRAAVQPAAWTPCELLAVSERQQRRARILLHVAERRRQRLKPRKHGITVHRHRWSGEHRPSRKHKQ